MSRIILPQKDLQGKWFKYDFPKQVFTQFDYINNNIILL